MLPPKKGTRGDLRARIEIAENLRLVRVTSGLLQREVAARMGRTGDVITLMENTPNWSVKSFLRWTHALHVKVTYDLGGLPPLDTSEPLVAAALARRPPHPLGEDALSIFLIDQHINQICRARGIETYGVHRDATVADLQRTVRRLGGVLKISMIRVE